MDDLIFLVQRIANQLFLNTRRMVYATLASGYGAFDNVRPFEGRPFATLALGYNALWIPGIDPTKFYFLSFVVPRDAFHNAQLDLPPFPCQQQHDDNEQSRGQTLDPHYDWVHNNC
jgi:hypothetical protein